MWITSQLFRSATRAPASISTPNRFGCKRSAVAYGKFGTGAGEASEVCGRCRGGHWGVRVCQVHASNSRPSRIAGSRGELPDRTRRSCTRHPGRCAPGRAGGAFRAALSRAWRSATRPMSRNRWASAPSPLIHPCNRPDPSRCGGDKNRSFWKQARTLTSALIVSSERSRKCGCWPWWSPGRHGG
jgi:hypothetical protein